MKNNKIRSKIIKSHRIFLGFLNIAILSICILGFYVFMKLLFLTDSIETILLKVITVIVPTFLFGFLIMKFLSLEKLKEVSGKYCFNILGKEFKFISSQKHFFDGDGPMIENAPIVIDIKNNEVLISGEVNYSFSIERKIFQFKNNIDETTLISTDNNTQLKLSILNNYAYIKFNSQSRTLFIQEFDIISYSR